MALENGEHGLKPNFRLSVFQFSKSKLGTPQDPPIENCRLNDFQLAGKMA